MPSVGKCGAERVKSTAKDRMKWNSTPGFIGTSERETLLESAPMYSRKRLELEAEGVGASESKRSAMPKKKG